MNSPELDQGERIVLAIIIPVVVHLMLTIAQVKSGYGMPLVSELFACSLGLWIVKKETQTHPGMVSIGIVVMICALLFISMAIAVTLVGV